jgi:hypothetical protein
VCSQVLIFVRVFALLALCASLGCAPGRIADLKDSGRISAGLALGLSLDAKLGDLTHPALGIVSSGAMVGFDSREIDGAWFEARVSDPFAIHWYRREGTSWGYALNSSGWRGAWESLGWLDALDELDEPIDQEGLPETGTIFRGEMLDGKITVSRWLPIPGGPDDPSPLFAFATASDIQAGATLLVIGARVGFNPLEFLDFLLGFAGQDIAGDDPQD